MANDQINLIQNGDFKGNFYTPLIDSNGTPRLNMRVPNMHTFTFHEGHQHESDLGAPDPTVDTAADWLAPEMVFRSGDTIRFPFTERLPDSELTQFLTDDAPVVYHIFKRYGKQWWQLSQSNMLPAGRYVYSIECWPDVYVGNHVWDQNPSSYEIRLRVGGQPDVNWENPPKGRWSVLTLAFDWHGGPCVLSVENRQRYGVEVGGTFLRREKLFAVSQSDQLGDDLKARTIANVNLILDIANKAKIDLEGGQG